MKRGLIVWRRANEKRNFRKERNMTRNFTGYVCFKGRKGQINVGQINVANSK